MIDQQRDELRKIQDDYLKLHSVKRFASAVGESAPLGMAGPSVSDVRTTLYPDYRYAFELALHNARRES
jgi:hypothetical protein